MKATIEFYKLKKGLKIKRHRWGFYLRIHSQICSFPSDALSLDKLCLIDLNFLLLKPRFEKVQEMLKIFRLLYKN